jgi:hypothetical protein
LIDKLLVFFFITIIFLIAESPAGPSRGQEDDQEEERMVLEDQPLVSEAVATLLAEVVSQTDEVRQGDSRAGSGRKNFSGGPGQVETVFQA